MKAEVFDFNCDIPETKWLVKDLIPLGQLVISVAQSGSGKSFYGEALATSIVYNKLFLGHATHDGDVLIIDQDTPTETLNYRLKRFGAEYGGNPKHKLFVSSMKNLSLTDGTLINTIKDHPSVVFVLIDSLHSIFGNLNPDSTKDMNKLAEFKQVCVHPNITVMFNHHISEKVTLTADEFMTCEPRKLPMGSSTINQQADTYYILATPDTNGTLTSLYVRPVAKRVSIPSKTFITRFVDGNTNTAIFEYSGDYQEPDNEVEGDIMVAFQTDETPIARDVKEVFEMLGGKHPEHIVRANLKQLATKGKLNWSVDRSKTKKYRYSLPV